MIKSYIATAALSLVALVAGAQSQPNRLLVHQKSGAVKSYSLGSVDSLSFYTIEGSVRANVTLNKYNSGKTGDTLWVAVKKTDACSSYRIDVLPTARVKAYSDNDIARYFDMQQGTAFTDDFTNAQLTGFSTQMVPGSNYTVFTLGYDRLGTPCEVSRDYFDTPADPVKGNPQVECTYTAESQAITFSFKPNTDVLNYYITIFEKGQGEAQFNQWAPMFGFANMSQMIEQFSGQAYVGSKTQTISGLVPGTDYELYILPIDRNGNYAPLQIIPCATAKMGGSGVASVRISVMDDFTSVGDGQYTQTVVYTPNDQTSLHRDMIITKDAFSDKNGQWKGDEQNIIKYLQTPNDMDPYWDQYGTDNARWNVTPSTTYIAYSIGQNADGKWGELAKREFTTPSSASAPAFHTTAPAQRVAPANGAKTVGKAPVKALMGVRLAE